MLQFLLEVLRSKVDMLQYDYTGWRTNTLGISRRLHSYSRKPGTMYWNYRSLSDYRHALKRCESPRVLGDGITGYVEERPMAALWPLPLFAISSPTPIFCIMKVNHDALTIFKEVAFGA